MDVPPLWVKWSPETGEKINLWPLMREKEDIFGVFLWKFVENEASLIVQWVNNPPAIFCRKQCNGYIFSAK